MLVLDGHKSAVYALAFAPDGDRLASGDREGNVLLWQGGRPERLAAADPDGAVTVNGIAMGADGRVVVACSLGWYSLMPDWDVFPGDPRLVAHPQLGAHPPGTTGVAIVTADLLAVGGGNRGKPEGGLLVLQPRGVKSKPVTFSAPQGVRSVSAAGERVAWSEWGRLLYVWDIRKPDRVKLPLAAEAPCVALAPDGTQLAAGVDYKVKLYDVASKRERLSLDGHTGRVTGVAFTPDGGTVVSGSWDGTVRLWDATSGSPRAVFQWPVGKVTSLAVSPDGLRLAVGGDTGAVVLADLD